MPVWLLTPAAGLLLFAAGATVAGESATDRARDHQAPPAEEAETDRRGPLAETFPGPRLSDRPFRPRSPDSPAKGNRPADRDCCSMEH